ncbi:hypothetical protein ACLOJK_024057, partial [Asimina triloba]
MPKSRICQQQHILHPASTPYSISMTREKIHRVASSMTAMIDHDDGCSVTIVRWLSSPLSSNSASNCGSSKAAVDNKASGVWAS